MKKIFIFVVCIFISSQLLSESINNNKNWGNLGLSIIHQKSSQDFLDRTGIDNLDSENDTSGNVNFTQYPRPILIVDPTDIDIGILHPNDPFSQRFIVGNNGPGILSGTISADTSWINSIVPSVFGLSQDENIEVRISGNIPGIQNEYFANIFVDSDIGTDTVYVHGWCTETTGLIFTFDNEEISEENNEISLEFDVMMSASETGSRLGSAMIYVSYNSAAFGGNIYTNNNLDVTKGEILMGQLGGVDLYEIINILDNDSSKVAITTGYSSLPPTYANEIPITPIQYLHLCITWYDESEYSHLSFDNDLMIDQQYFANDSTKFYPVIAIDSLNITGYPDPEPPENVNIMIVGFDLSITWDPVDGATSYSIYSSEHPFAGFALEASNITNTYWNKTIQGLNKQFYYVTAFVGDMQAIPKILD